MSMGCKPLGYSRSEIDTATLEEVVSLIPAIERVEDRGLRDAVALTWACAWKDSDYETLGGVLQGQGPVKLLRHVNGVNDHVDYVVGLAEGTYGLRVDHDVVLAAAILHDVDKPLLWTSDGNDRISFRPGRSLRDHGVLGAQLAEICGVPEEVHRIVRGHSPYSDLMEERRSIEAVLVYQADGLEASLGALSVGCIPACGLTKLVPAPF